MAGPSIGTAKQVFKIPPDIKEWTVTKGRSARTRVAIYLRVSTGEQTTDNQRRELEAVAMRKPAKLVQEMTDAGAGGADHLGQRFLTDVRTDRLRAAFLPKIGQEKQQASQSFLARIK